MSFIRENKIKILKVIVFILAIPYLYILINVLFQFGRYIGTIGRMGIGY